MVFAGLIKMVLEVLKKIFGEDDDDRLRFLKHLSGCEDEEGGFGEEPC